MNFQKQPFARSTVKSGTCASRFSVKNAPSSVAPKMPSALRSRCIECLPLSYWGESEVPGLTPLANPTYPALSLVGRKKSAACVLENEPNYAKNHFVSAGQQTRKELTVRGLIVG